eukprot:4996545-Amphidinium_carterae.1
MRSYTGLALTKLYYMVTGFKMRRVRALQERHTTQTFETLEVNYVRQLTQQTIAQSSAGAELYAIGTTVNDVIYVRNFPHELKFTQDNRFTPHIYTDSSSDKCLTEQLGLTNSTKHIDIWCLHVQQLQYDQELRIHEVFTKKNPAVTKYLETAKIFWQHWLYQHDWHYTTTDEIHAYYTKTESTTTSSCTTRSRLPVGEIDKVEDEDHHFDDHDVINNHVQDATVYDIQSTPTDLTRLLMFLRQLLMFFLSLLRLCDEWRRRPVQATPHFLQRHDNEITNMTRRTS